MSRLMKPFSEACARNQDAILGVLRDVFADRRRVLEMGSGTGQHAVHFGRHLPHLEWQTGDLEENHVGIRAWLAEANLPNILPPVKIDADEALWPVRHIDAVFSANVVHIMSWPRVVSAFEKIGQILRKDGVLVLYGPFNYGGKFTSESNAQFDQMLKDRDPESGVRDFEAIDQLAGERGFKLSKDFAMPANNRLLVWRT